MSSFSRKMSVLLLKSVDAALVAARKLLAEVDESIRSAEALLMSVKGPSLPICKELSFVAADIVKSTVEAEAKIEVDIAGNFAL